MATFHLAPLLARALWALAVLGAPAAAQYSPPVLLPGDASSEPAAGSQDNADVSPGGPGFLVVWEDGRAALSGTAASGGLSDPTEIYAARLDAAGRLLDSSPLFVSRQPFADTRPRAAWNGSTWLVVWQGTATTQFYFSAGIYAARISASGQLLDPAPIRIENDDYVDEALWDASSDGVNWAVIWQDTNASNGWTLSGCLVDPSGAVFGRRDIFSFAPGASSSWNARLAWARDRYLMAYEQFASSNDIKGQLLDAALNKIGGAFTITSNAWDQDRPTVAANGTDFYVAWADGQLSGKVFGTPVLASGTVLIPGGANLAGSLYPNYPSPAAAWDGTQWAVLWENWSYPAGYSLFATQVDTSGSVLGSPIPLAAGPGLTNPEAASATGGVLGVWTDTINAQSIYGDARDLFAGGLSAGGQPGPQACITRNPPAQTHPDMAGDRNAYLAVFLSRTTAEMRVMAQRVDFFGRALDAQPQLLASGPNTLGPPAVAWNGSLWLVVWEDIVAAGSPPAGARVKGRRMLPDGTLLDPVPLDILPGNTPAVAAIGDTFLVAASHEPTNHQRWIKAARVQGSSGTVLDPAPLNISPIYSVAPAVGAFADRWIVLWQQHPSHDNPNSYVQASFVTAAGAPGTPFLACSSGSGKDRAPAVAMEGPQAFFTWDDSADVRGRFIRSDGTLLGAAAGQQLTAAANAQFASAVAWNGTQYLAGWSDYRLHPNLVEPGIGDAYSTRVRSDGTVVDPPGLAFAADPASVEGNFAAHGARGTSVAACAALRPEAPYGTHRILVRNLGPILTQTDLRRGQPATFSVSGAEPGDLAAFLYSLAGTGGGPAVGQLGGLRLDLLPPITLMGQVPVGAAGTASLTLTVPPNVPLVTVHTQAALRRGPGGANSGKTDTISAPILP